VAIIRNGINGPFSGKIGDTVGTSWRGLSIIRSRPKPPTHFSEKQLANQLKMKVVQLFLKQLVEPIRIGFKDDTVIPTAFNSALSYHKKFAIVGEYPNLYMDLAKVKISRGILFIPPEILMEWDDTGLHLSWTKNLDENAKPDDQLLLVLWNESEKITQYSLQVYRSAGQFNWKPDFPFTGSHLWAAFIRQDRSMQSESKYLGVIL
jgi:hypothetical protein